MYDGSVGIGVVRVGAIGVGDCGGHVFSWRLVGFETLLVYNFSLTLF